MAAGRREQLTSRRAIVRRWARLTAGGQPMQCWPSRAELAGERVAPERDDGKVIFDDARAAAGCAGELYVDGGSLQVPYPCARSRHGHYHLRRAGAANDEATPLTRR